ncbi:hypothetical protein B0H21DRAFT_665216, partial [Amylocystis lapponica]
LILYIGTSLEEEDFPHRDKTHKLILARYQLEKTRMSHDAQNALGRVSFTTDLWTDKKMRSFMAITLHYCTKDTKRRLVLRARL